MVLPPHNTRAANGPGIGGAPLPPPPPFGGADTSAALALNRIGSVPSRRSGKHRSWIDLRAVLDEPDPDPEFQHQVWAEAVEAGVDALLRKDHEAALRAYRRAQAVRPEDTMVAANVRRLTRMVAALGVRSSTSSRKEEEE